jgi:hypothetical protein
LEHKYVVSRVSEVVVGKENQRFDGLVEIYWSNETGIDESYSPMSEAKLSTVETILAELEKWVSVQSVFTMQESVGKEYQF